MRRELSGSRSKSATGFEFRRMSDERRKTFGSFPGENERWLQRRSPLPLHAAYREARNALLNDEIQFFDSAEQGVNVIEDDTDLQSRTVMLAKAACHVPLPLSVQDSDFF